ncbi:MAG: hypothetical protein GTN64_05625 [Candidatus Latescibacteria bacterium]|nr:hypothetical protein [Candidatus Latescibacterota bacterium]NIO78089.1 hypothetical protein [Candidatus Latescibacterota bacterium]
MTEKETEEILAPDLLAELITGMSESTIDSFMAGVSVGMANADSGITLEEFELHIRAELRSRFNDKQADYEESKRE